METEVKTTKVCNKCGLEKDLTLFRKEKRVKSGLRSHCKQCDNVYAEAYRKANLEKKRAYNRKWRKENHEKAKAITKKYRDNNRKKIRLYKKKWGRENPEKIKAYKKKWRIKNPEKSKQISAKGGKKRTLNLTSYYATQILLTKGFRKEDITDELINVQQLIIKTKRLCKTSHN